MNKDKLKKTVRGIAVMPIRLYQRAISPLTSAKCRYYPTCSSYSIQAIKKHGIFWGAILTVWRILRCNPWSRGGIDYVPERITAAYFFNREKYEKEKEKSRKRKK